MQKHIAIILSVVVLFVLAWFGRADVLAEYSDQGQTEVSIETSDTLSADEEDTVTTVLCFGDSNTYGVIPNSGGDRYEESLIWTTILADQLGDSYQVIPEGFSGRTTAYDYNGSADYNGLTALTPCLEANMPVDVVVFMLGTNDCKTSLGLDADAISAGMEELIQTTETVTREEQGYPAQIILVTPGAISDDLSDSVYNEMFDRTSAEKSRELGTYYEALAEKYDCLYLDGTDLLDVSGEDGIHLTEDGHRQLAEEIYRMITQ